MKSAEWCYFAKFEDGCVLETQDLKTLYYAAKCELRCQYGHSLFFTRGEVSIYEGVRVDWAENGVNHSKYVKIKEILSMRCNSLDRITNFHVVKEA